MPLPLRVGREGSLFAGPAVAVPSPGAGAGASPFTSSDPVMKLPQQQLDSRIALAATLRAGGASWADVAAKVGRSDGSVRHWATGFFVARPNADAQHACKHGVTAILDGVINENTGHFVSRWPQADHPKAPRRGQPSFFATCIFSCNDRRALHASGVGANIAIRSAIGVFFASSSPLFLYRNGMPTRPVTSHTPCKKTSNP
jgi:hypothetical protein